jgi:hypothetical protein
MCCTREVVGRDAGGDPTRLHCGGEVVCAGVLGRADHQRDHGPSQVYAEARAEFGPGAQLAMCARPNASAVLKSITAKQRDTCLTFGSCGRFRDDAGTYRQMSLDRVSLVGRVVCPCALASTPCRGTPRGWWAVPTWSGEQASTPGTVPRAAQCQTRPSLLAGRWASTWTSPLAPPTARVNTSPEPGSTVAETLPAAASKTSACATPGGGSAAWATTRPAFRQTPTTAAARDWSTKPSSIGLWRQPARDRRKSPA